MYTYILIIYWAYFATNGSVLYGTAVGACMAEPLPGVPGRSPRMLSSLFDFQEKVSLRFKERLFLK